jgi:hypothetical protein
MLAILIFIIITFLIYFIFEHLYLKRVLNRIPIRILVNGTRGKTTTVKILHAILNENRLPTFSKITGDSAVLLKPDGNKKYLKRFAPVNIKENIRILISWSREKPKAVVLECMALHPERQYSLSWKIFKPNYLLLTNIGKDHLEIMGNDESEIAKTMIQSFYKNARIYVCQDILKKHKLPESFGGNIQSLDPLLFERHIPNIPPHFVNQSWSLICGFSQYLKLDIEKTENIFYKLWSEVSDNLIIKLASFNLELFNLFSVNDCASAEAFIHHFKKHRLLSKQQIVLANLRRDRPLRTIEFAGLIKRFFPETTIWATGNGRYFFHHVFKTINHTNNQLRLMSQKMIGHHIKKGFSTPTQIIGLVNHQGIDTLLQQLKMMQ